MSVETLKADLKANLAELAQMSELTVSAADILKHLKGTLWPMLEAVVDETSEIDDCVADMIAGAEDILQPETAEVFAAIIAGAKVAAAAVRTNIPKEQNPQLHKIMDELEKNLVAGEEIMKEIVIDPGDDADDDDEDDEDDDDDADDTDEEGEH